MSTQQIHHLKAHQECIWGRRTTARRNRCIFCNSSKWREKKSRKKHRLLQPRYDYQRRLSRSFISWRTVPYVGYEGLERIHRKGVCSERWFAETGWMEWEISEKYLNKNLSGKSDEREVKMCKKRLFTLHPSFFILWKISFHTAKG